MELLLKIESTGDFLSFLRRCKADTIDFYYTNGVTHVVEINTFWKQDMIVPSECTGEFITFNVSLDVLKNVYSTGYLKFVVNDRQLQISNIFNHNVICSTEVALNDSFTNRYYELLNLNASDAYSLNIPTVMAKLAGVMKGPVNFDSGIISVVAQQGFAVLMSTECSSSFALPHTPLLVGTSKLFQIRNGSSSLYGSIVGNYVTLLNEAHGYSNLEYLKMYQMQEDKLFECDVNVSNALNFLQKSSKATFTFDFKTQCVCVSENAIDYKLPFTVTNDVMYKQIKLEKIDISNVVFHTVFSIIKQGEFHFEVFPYFIRITLPGDIKVVFR